MSHYHLAILGGGPAGYAAALTAAQRGQSVALIDKRGRPGGVCLHRGCVPAKSLIAAAETVDHASHMNTLAQAPFDYTLDFGKATAMRRKIVEQSVKGLESLLAKRSVTFIAGEGAFSGPHEITITDGDGGETAITFDHALIAVGTEPPRYFGVPEERLINSDTLFDQEELPRSVIILGGGYIGCELAGVFARFGVRVTVAELEKRLLPMEDGDISATLTREFKKKKIAINTGAGVEKFEEGGEGVMARFKDGSEATAEKVLLSVGKRFNTGALGLDTIGVKRGAKGEVIVNESYQTELPHIYAAGDVAARTQLAYTAYREGVFVVDHLEGKKTAYQQTALPRIVFTIPEIGAVGLTGEEAPADALVGTFHMRALARAHTTGEIAGFVKVIADKESDRLLGVHIIGARATDMIHIASVAIAQGMTAAAFGDLLFGHPTFAEALLEAVHDLHGRSLHQ